MRGREREPLVPTVCGCVRFSRNFWKYYSFRIYSSVNDDAIAGRTYVHYSYSAVDLCILLAGPDYSIAS